MRRFATSISLILFVFLATACRWDGEVLSDFEGGKVTRGELRSAFRLMDGGKNAGLEMQDRVLTELSLFKLTGLEALKQGLDKSEAFKNRLPLLEKVAFIGALESELLLQSKKKKLKMIDLQFAFLQEATQPHKRKEEADDLAKKLNAASDSEVQKIILQKTENKRYGVLGGFVDPLCASCQPNPYAFITDPAEKNDGKFAVVEDTAGFWIVRKIAVKEYSGDDLENLFEGYWKKVMRIARATLPTMPDNNERKEFESTLLGESQIEQMAKQQAEQMIKRESQGLLQKRVEERKKALNFEATPGVKKYMESQDPKAVPGPDAAFKFGTKTVTVRELLDSVPEDPNQPDKRGVLHQVILPYELLRDDELKDKTLGSPQYSFLVDWNRNNQLTMLLLEQQKPEDVTEQQILDRYKLRQFDEFKDQALGAVHDRIKTELRMGSRQAALKKLQDDLSKKYNLKIHKEKLKGGEV